MHKNFFHSYIIIHYIKKVNNCYNKKIIPFLRDYFFIIDFGIIKAKPTNNTPVIKRPTKPILNTDWYSLDILNKVNLPKSIEFINPFLSKNL